jgi:hypothetical protein
MRTKLFQTVCIAATCVLSVSSAAPTQAQGQREGIVVHGHWTLEVRNVDGSVGERREFENALMPEGVKTLAQLLARQRSVGRWIVRVQGSTNTNVGMFGGGAGNIGGNTAAYLVEPGPVSNTYTFPDLSVGLDQSLTKIVLRGTVKATLTGAVTVVGTMVHAPCVVDASDCGSQNSFQFTESPVKENNVIKPLHLEKDQSVLVTVAISFSSPAGS